MNEFIEFPALGWRFDVNPVLAEDVFGLPISIRWYGVLIAVGFLLAVLYAVRTATPRFGIKLDPMTDVVLVATLCAILGARVYYILFYNGISTFWEEPLKVFRIWDGGLAIYGGVIAAFVTGIWMCKLKKINMWAMFDLASIGFLIGQSLGRWGNFFNQEAFGGNTTLPWGMTGSIIQSPADSDMLNFYDPALPVHPTFLYESLWCLAGFILLHILSKKSYTFKGKLFCLYIIWYGAGRFFIEGLRTDSLAIGTLRVSQLVAAICVLGGLGLYFLLKSRAQRSPKDLFVKADNSILGEDVSVDEFLEETAQSMGEESEQEENDDGETD